MKKLVFIMTLFALCLHFNADIVNAKEIDELKIK